jgi:hypothetical protein
MANEDEHNWVDFQDHDLVQPCADMERTLVHLWSVYRVGPRSTYECLASLWGSLNCLYGDHVADNVRTAANLSMMGRDAEFGMLYYFLEDNDYCGRNLLQFCGINLREVLENVPINPLNLFSTWVEEASDAENLPELYSHITELYGSGAESDFRFLLEMSTSILEPHKETIIRLLHHDYLDPGVWRSAALKLWRDHEILANDPV